MIRSQHIVNVGPYQHVEVVIEGNDLAHYLSEMDSFVDAVKVRLGVFQAELESWIVPTRENILNGVTDAAAEMVQSLGATVIEEKPVEMPEPEAQQESRKPWERQVQPERKAWDPKPETKDDDWFD